MRKIYPYLKENYYSIESQAVQQRNFLSQIDDFVNQKQYIKITLLDWQERPLREISGEITSGSITKDGTATVRRTLNLSCTMDSNSYDINDLKSNFAINKKIYVEVGIKNYTKKYMDEKDPKNYFPILWFPQGVFFIGQFSISSSVSGLNLTITGKDKMCKLNGDIGGQFPATIIFNKMDVTDINGNTSTTDVRIYDIIQECVNHYGEEDLNNIVIEDVPLQIKQVMSWNSQTPIFGYYQTNSLTQQTQSYILTYDEKTIPANTPYQRYNQGDDVGYIYTDFVWTGSDLVGAPGESITSILDKIKSMLGNYEYFYDVYGIFHFQEIKNYLNTTLAKTVTNILEDTRNVNNILSQLNEEDYIIETTAQKSVYNFTDNKNLTQLSVNPQYENIRNDYIVLGETNDEVKSRIRYHLAIDNKPNTDIEYNTPMICYKRATDGLKVLSVPIEIDITNIGLSNSLFNNLSNLNNYKKQLEKEKEKALAAIDTAQKDAVNKAFQQYANQLAIDNLKDSFFSSTYAQNKLGYTFTIKDQKIIIKFNNGKCNYIFKPSDFFEEDEKNSWYEQYLNYITNRKQIQKQKIEIPREHIENRYYFATKINKQDANAIKNNLTYWDNVYSKDVLDNQEYSLASLEIAIANIAKNNIANNSIIKNNTLILNQISNLLQNQSNLFEDLKEKQFESCIKLFTQKNINALPQKGNTGFIYYCKNLFNINNNNNTPRFYFYWDNNEQQYKLIDYIAEYPNGYRTKNWQTHLYIMGLIEHNLAKDSSQYQNIKKSTDNSSFNVSSSLGKTINADYYFEELNAFWPLVFDFEKNDYYGSNTDKEYLSNKIKDLNRYKNIFENNLKIAQKIQKEAQNQYQVFENYFNQIKTMYDYFINLYTATSKGIETCKSKYKQYFYDIFIDNPEESNSNTKWFFDLYNQCKNILNEFFDRNFDYSKIKTTLSKKWPNDFFTNPNHVYVYKYQLQNNYATPNTTSLIYIDLWNALNNIVTPYRIGNIEKINNIEENAIETLKQQKIWFENMYEIFHEKIVVSTETIFTVLTQTYLNEKMFSRERWEQLKNTLTQSYQWVNLINSCLENLTILDSLYNKELDETNSIEEQIIKCYNDANKSYLNNSGILKENVLYNVFSEKNNEYYNSKNKKIISITSIKDKWPNLNTEKYVNYTQKDKNFSTKEKPKLDDYKKWLEQWIEIINSPRTAWKERLDYWTNVINALTTAIAQCSHAAVQEKINQDLSLYKGQYYLDFIEPKNSNIGEFCVSNIGRRQLIEKNSDINCLFDIPIPNIIFINSNAVDAAKQRNKAESNGLIWSQVNQEIYKNFIAGGWKRPAWEVITNNLYLHTTYQKTISLTALPAFYLEPNSRVTINDRTTQTYGDYNITSITLPLGAGQLMTASGSEIVQQR